MTLFWQYKQFTDLNKFVDDFSAYADTYKIGSITDINIATGYSLDMIGKIINIDRRPILITTIGSAWNQFNWGQENWNSATVLTDIFAPMSDTSFRKLLNMRVLQLIEARTLDNLLKDINIILPTMIYTYSEIANEVTITYEKSSILYEDRQIMKGGYLLIPQGCQLIVNEI